ncbi:hypothetical protein SO802_003572 [Lithocarpus litseifolius]|uniref:GH18 domain-containing protein n=1 Tax=Lithocarpus litseifolius TaxID=425828 RepID=A0AAW2E0M2_9ROSI
MLHAKTPLVKTLLSIGGGASDPTVFSKMAIRKYLDWVSPMCFDYHGKGDKLTGEHSALDDHKSNISTYFGIGSWIQAGVPSHKLVMGLPLYGKTWKLQDPEVNGIGAPAIGVRPRVDGMLDHYHILDFNNKNKTTIVFDTETMSYYSYVGDSRKGMMMSGR